VGSLSLPPQPDQAERTLTKPRLSVSVNHVDELSPEWRELMKLSTRGRYGARALVDLALRYGEGPLLLRDIAKRQDISEHYLEHLCILLKAAGIIKSIRGARGGVALAKPPSEIRLSEVIQTLEGSTAPVECVNDAKICQRSASCATRDIWGRIRNAIDEVLESTTLQDLAERQREKEKNESVMYYI